MWSGKIRMPIGIFQELDPDHNLLSMAGNYDIRKKLIWKNSKKSPLFYRDACDNCPKVVNPDQELEFWSEFFKN